MKHLFVSVVLLGSAVASACGGGGGGSADQEQLDRIRSEFTSTSLASEEDVIAALGIAERNAGDPLGDDAFELAQEMLLDSLGLFFDGDFASRAPEPPVELSLMPGDTEFRAYRVLAGFVDATPGVYDPAAVREHLRNAIISNDVRHYLFRLDDALANRQLWVSELETAGETSRSFTGIDGWDGFATYVIKVGYLRELATFAGLPPDFLAAIDSLNAALTVADFAPPTVETRLEGETIVTLYSAEAVAAAGEHTRQLIAAIATARAAFPTIE